MAKRGLFKKEPTEYWETQNINHETKIRRKIPSRGIPNTSYRTSYQEKNTKKVGTHMQLNKDFN